MKLRDKIKSYSFWVSLASAVILILKLLGNRFGFSVDETMVSDIFTALCSILVLLGIIVVPSYNQTTSSNQKNDNSEININPSDNKSSKPLDNIQPKEEVLNEKENVNPNNQLGNKNENIDLESSLENQIQDTSFKTQIQEESNKSINIEDPCLEQIKEQSFDEDSVENKNTSSETQKQDNLTKETVQSKETHHQENTEVFDLKTLFENERKKFAGNLDAYIFELQEEIRKTRESV